jgi:hypothetical protein
VPLRKRIAKAPFSIFAVKGAPPKPSDCDGS